jgi:serine/threonine protein kinase/formylglycine-generating enzyme required for sulfatase activity
MEPWAGRILGDYRIIEEIGAGGMGRVFLAENVHHKKRCAIKILPEELSRDVSFRARFFDEARVMSDLNHANIVRVHHTGEDKGVYYLVMDYVSSAGGRSHSIHDELIQSPARRIAASKAHAWVTQVAQALAYAHHRGVIHRDIKPANILIDAEGNARVTDFGLAKAVGKEFLLSQIHKTLQQTSRTAARDLTAGGLKLPGVLHDFELAETTRRDVAEGNLGRRSPSGDSGAGSGSYSLFGTYDYMSPELLEGKDATVQSDIYSLGVMTYRMLTGRRPVGLAKPPSTIVRGLSRKWDLITARCLADNAADRYASVGALLEDLEKIGRRSRRKIGAAVGLVLLVAALSLAGWTYLRPDRPNREPPKANAPSQASKKAAAPLRQNPAPESGQSQKNRPPEVPAPAKGPDNNAPKPPAAQDRRPETESAAYPQQAAEKAPSKTAKTEVLPTPLNDARAIPAPDKPRAPDPGQLLERSLDECYALDDTLPDLAGGMTIRSLYERWPGKDKADEVDARVKALMAIEKELLPADLVKAANDSHAYPEAILAAWSRLDTLPDGWPRNTEQWSQDNQIRAKLLDQLQERCNTNRLSQNRWAVIRKQIEDAARQRERTLRLALIDEYRKTIESKNTGDEFLQNVARLDLTGTDRVTTLQDWETKAKDLLDFVSKSGGLEAYDRKRFYQPGEKGQPFLLKKMSLEPNDLRDWQVALAGYPRAKATPAAAPRPAPGPGSPGIGDPNLTVEIRDAKGGKQIKLELRLIKAKGLWFWTGIPRGTLNRTIEASDPPQKLTRLLSDFYIGKYEITQDQYEAVTQTNPSRFKKGANRPVEDVSWDQAVDFCKRLSNATDLRFFRSNGLEYHPSAAPAFRLPSEKEWEYACRAQTGMKEEPPAGAVWMGYQDFSDEDDKRKLSKAWCWYDATETDVVGGGRRPNAFVLYDMHGNVWEWCSDEYKETDGGEPGRTGHVVRGGAYNSTQWDFRSGWRSGRDGPEDNVGFRVVLEMK